MTTREFLSAVIAANLSAEMTEKAENMLAAAERKNGKRAETQTINRFGNLAIAAALIEKMEIGRIYAISEIKVLATDYPEISTSKLSAVFKAAAEEELVEVVEGYKVGGKGRAVKGYKVRENETAED